MGRMVHAVAGREAAADIDAHEQVVAAGDVHDRVHVGGLAELAEHLHADARLLAQVAHVVGGID